jgi:hypothetical protein
MNIRRCTLAVSTAIALASSTANASPDTDAANACARALASSLAAPGRPPPSYKLLYRGSSSTDISLAFFATESTFNLQARDPKTHAVLARAQCSTDYRGIVVAFTSTPVDDTSATLAARGRLSSADSP